MIGKIQEVNGLLVTETTKYQAASEKLNYLSTFPYDVGVLLRKMNYVYPTSEVSFVALAGVKAKVPGDVILSDLVLGNDQKGAASLSVEVAGSQTSVLDFVSQVLEGYPVCDLSTLKFGTSGSHNLVLNFHQNTKIPEKLVFAKLLSDEETLVKEVLGVSISSGGESTSPSTYTRDNPF